MAKKRIETPNKGTQSFNDQVEIENCKKSILRATTDKETLALFQNKMGEFIRRKVIYETEMMEKIGPRMLQKKLRGIYKNGNFNITDKEARKMMQRTAKRFCEKRDNMTNEERLDYVRTSEEIYREDSTGQFNEYFREDKLKKDNLDIETIRNNQGDNFNEGVDYDPEDDPVDPHRNDPVADLYGNAVN